MEQEIQFLEIAKLIAKEMNKSISLEEKKDLENWIKESIENQNIYNEIKREKWFTENLESIKLYDIEEGWDFIRYRLKSTSKIRKLIPQVLKYAVVVILFIGLGYFFKSKVFNNINATPEIVNISIIEPGSNKATLTLGDGSQVALEKGNSFQTKNANSNGEEIIYKTVKTSSIECEYNYLTIPRGGQFFIKLADGTQVWLNSESQLKYPIAFNDTQTRQVELVYGEAYFDVSPSTNHKGMKFKVLNGSQKVEVLGTEFNIKAYKDETNVYTTLVEGKVVVTNELSKQNLAPNQQAVFDKKANNITISQIDVADEISWKKGLFSFHNKNIKDVMDVLARWYDIEVVFKNKELETIQFVGVLDMQQNIEEILSILKSTSINNYEIKNRTILLE